jgi:hypothetical protein
MHHGLELEAKHETLVDSHKHYSFIHRCDKIELRFDKFLNVNGYQCSSCLLQSIIM